MIALYCVQVENSHDSGMETDRKVFVNLQTGKKLGCGIGTGQNNEPGVFVLNISQGSLAEKMNFKVCYIFVKVSLINQFAPEAMYTGTNITH